MRRAFLLPLLLTGVCALPSLPSPARAQQTSVGFEDPTDVRSLFDYRLPDWGYRRTQANLQFGGSGVYGQVHMENASVQEGLGTRWIRESEPRTWSLEARQGASWLWRQFGYRGDAREAHHAIDANLQLAGATRCYGTRSWAVIAAAGFAGSTQDVDARPALAAAHTYLEAGIGLGRVRDVTPYLQARRVGERLRAIGREPLSPAQVRRLASVLAQRGGYLALFDRPERRFWEEALGPLSEGQPFTPFELFYLSEVVVEQLGARHEGLQCDLTARGVLDATRDSAPSTQIDPHLRVEWTHNQSLNSQTSVVLDAEYQWRRNDGRFEWGNAELFAEQLWVVADRVFWSNSARASVIRNPSMAPTWRRTAGFRSAFAYYVEDRVSLVPELNLGWGRSSGGGQPADEAWNWSVAFVVNYDLENRLF